MAVPVEALQDKLGYRFRHAELLIRALTHRSWSCERPLTLRDLGDNEQFEFLGDSILGFVVSEALVLKHPSASEGQLSQWKSHLVSANYLHGCALALGLGEYLLLGKGEERNGGRKRKTLLANSLEAIIAAVHLDGGIEAARTFIERHVLGELDSLDKVAAFELFNHKSVLQELTQAHGLPPPRYSMIEASGPEHAKVFTVEVRVGERLVCRATGSSKKAASQRAAELLIQELKAECVTQPIHHR